MDSIFGLCCVNRQKEDLDHSVLQGASRPVDYIKSKPGLVRVLRWFEDIEDQFRDSMKEVETSLESIISVLDDQCDEEIIELSKGKEIVAKVVHKRAVADILRFGRHQNSTMQQVLEKIEFFKVESQESEQSDQYDFNKLILFCLLFCDESYSNKITCLFYLMCDEDNLITSKNGQVKTIIAILTIISCMIPAEMIKIDKLSTVGFEEMQDFNDLYHQYCCQPPTFNKFTTYLKNSKLFVSMRGPLNLHSFRQLMFEQENIFIDSTLIRQEYTYFVCFQLLPEHANYFNRPSFQTQVSNSFRESQRSFVQYGGGRQSIRDAQSELLSSDGNNRRGKGGNRAMQQARQSINQYENDLESMRGANKKGKKTTKGGPVLQDQANRQRESRYSYDQSEDSIAYNNHQKKKQPSPDRDPKLHQISEDDNRSDDDEPRQKKKSAAKTAKGSLSKNTKKQQKRRQTEESKGSSDEDEDEPLSETERDTNVMGAKEEIDIMVDDTVPKKNKKTKKEIVVESDDDSMDFEEQEETVQPKKKSKKDKKSAKLDQSSYSVKSAFDRSSVKSGMSRKRTQSIEEFIANLVGQQFYDLVYKLSSEQKAESDLDNGIKGQNSAEKKLVAKREKRFAKNRELLLDPDGFEIPFPKTMYEYPTHIREVFQFIQNAITAGDLVALQEGETSEESLINVYFKVLEKINLVLLRANDFLKMQANAQQHEPLALVPTQKVLYCNTNFLRELKNCAPNDYDLLKDGPETDQKRKYEKIIKDITDHEVVLIPFYPELTKESEVEQTPMLVELRPKTYTATLYMKTGDRITTTTAGGDTPSPTEATADMISEEVMRIFTNVSKFFNEEFDIEMVDGGTCEVCVTSDEEYMVAMAYVADCHTYKREVNLEKFDVQRERNKMVDAYLSLLNFQ